MSVTVTPLLRLVTIGGEILTNQAEHTLRFLLRAYLRWGRSRPRTGRNVTVHFPMVLRCNGSSANKHAQWKKLRRQRTVALAECAAGLLRSIKSRFGLARRIHRPPNVFDIAMEFSIACISPTPPPTVAKQNPVQSSQHDFEVSQNVKA